MGKAILWCVLFATASLHTSAQNPDIDVVEALNPDHPSSDYWKFTSASTYATSAGIPAGIFVAGVLEHDKELKKKSFEMGGALLIELLISESVKSTVKRPRPAEKFPDLIHPYQNMHGRSFPSGHTSLAFATAASLSLQCRKWYVVVPAYMWACSVGYSRMYLGVHYPSDVIGGAITGIGSAYLSHWLYHKLFVKPPPQQPVM